MFYDETTKIKKSFKKMEGLLIKNVNDICLPLTSLLFSDFKPYPKSVVCCPLTVVVNYKFALKYSVIFVTRCALSGPYTLWS